MQTPAQIEFEHVTPSPKLQAAIEGHIAELEKRIEQLRETAAQLAATALRGEPLPNVVNGVGS